MFFICISDLETRFSKHRLTVEYDQYQYISINQFTNTYSFINFKMSVKKMSAHIVHLRCVLYLIITPIIFFRIVFETIFSRTCLSWKWRFGFYDWAITRACFQSYRFDAKRGTCLTQSAINLGTRRLGARPIIVETLLWTLFRCTNSISCHWFDVSLWFSGRRQIQPWFEI